MFTLATKAKQAFLEASSFEIHSAKDPHYGSVIYIFFLIYGIDFRLMISSTVMNECLNHLLAMKV